MTHKCLFTQIVAFRRKANERPPEIEASSSIKMNKFIISLKLKFEVIKFDSYLNFENK